MEAFFCELDTSAAQTDNSDLCKHAHEETFFKTLTGMDASSGHTLATGRELMKFYANSLKPFFLPLLHLQAGGGKQSLSQLLRCFPRVHIHVSAI